MPGPFERPEAYWAGPAASLLFSTLSLLLLIGIPALLFWAATRRPAFGRPASTAEPAVERHDVSAVEILRQRYALGEIDTVTFEQMLERLLASEAREYRDERVQRLMTGEAPPHYSAREEWYGGGHG